jgi:hypothetical protein
MIVSLPRNKLSRPPCLCLVFTAKEYSSSSSYRISQSLGEAFRIKLLRWLAAHDY